MVDRLKAVGIVVISTATTVAEARTLAAGGADAVIAQGWEAGGHRGAHLPPGLGDGVGTLALVPQIADAVDVLVIAAGGIGDGRGIAAAFASGAASVQMGTAFLSTDEAGTDPAGRALLRVAKDSDTMKSDAFSGRAARARRNRYAMEMARHQTPPPDFPDTYALSGPLADAGPEEFSFHLYGQSATLNREGPTAYLMARLVAESVAVRVRLVGRDPSPP